MNARTRLRLNDVVYASSSSRQMSKDPLNVLVKALHEKAYQNQDALVKRGDELLPQLESAFESTLLNFKNELLSWYDGKVSRSVEVPLEVAIEDDDITLAQILAKRMGRRFTGITCGLTFLFWYENKRVQMRISYIPPALDLLQREVVQNNKTQQVYQWKPSERREPRDPCLIS